MQLVVISLTAQSWIIQRNEALVGYWRATVIALGGEFLGIEYKDVSLREEMKRIRGCSNLMIVKMAVRSALVLI